MTIRSVGQRIGVSNRALLAMGVGLGAMMGSLGAHAAAAAAQAQAPGTEVQEVIVTAQKREQRLQDVPVAVTVLNKVQLQQAGVNPSQEPRRAVVPVEGPFAGKTFVITGALSQSREEIAAWIEARGGKVSESVSKKTSYVVVGDAPGASKVTKATTLNIPMIGEDELRAL